MPDELSLVTGANGHLGNTLVRELLGRGRRVRAGVHHLDRAGAVAGMPVEVVRAEMTDTQSLLDAMSGATTVYHSAGVFKHWARREREEIVQPNVEGTRNTIRAAAERGVRRVVYVSSSLTLDTRHAGSIDELAWPGHDFGNPYVRGKIEADQEAQRLSMGLQADVIAALPTTIVGPYAEHLTPPMRLLDRVLNGRLVVSPDLGFTFVDVRDVAAGLIAAADNGRRGERYLLAGTRAVAVREIVDLAREVSPQPLPTPRILDRRVAMALAISMSAYGRLTGKEPPIHPSQLRLSRPGAAPFSAGKAERELGWVPRSSERAVLDALTWLLSRRK